MKQEIPIRITVVGPVSGVMMQVQRGKDELLPPSASSATTVSFDFTITVDLSGDAPNYLGKFAQGPKDTRFVYVNSGTYAGQHSCWGRRAKISLMTITREQIDQVLTSSAARLEAEIAGTARDGGPMCASVPVIGGWRVVK